MNKHSVALIALCGFVLVGAAAIVGYFLRPSAPPAELQTAPPVLQAPATAQAFTDTRKVQVRLVPEPDVTIRVTQSGVLTSTSCVPGNPIESGTSVARVDDIPLLALHLTVPPFRDLVPGTKGQDVQALQQELARLGTPVEESGFFGWDTSVAVSALRERAGLNESNTFELGELIWLPKPSVPVTECSATLGETLAPGAPFATAKGPLRELIIDNAPSALVTGERTLTVFGITGPLGKDNRVTDPDFLSALSKMNEIQTVLADQSNTPVPATLALSEPVTAIQVPASAVFVVNEGVGCVQSDGVVHPVTILGSTLGASLVALTESTVQIEMVDLGTAIKHVSC